MEKHGVYWLIGAKLVCCGALLLVLTGVISLGAITALLVGNAIPVAVGSAIVALVIALRVFKARRA